MFSIDDTIVAIATPPGRAGLGVVRISGPGAGSVARAVLTRREPLQPLKATFTRVRLPTLQPGASESADAPPSDEVVAISFPAPRSYTGQDVVEISAHGSPVILHGIVAAAIRAGARLARPGEFTLRAFLTGKRDLVQAEAVGDLIAAATPLQARVAFDQLEGTLTRRIREIDARLFDLIARLEASLDFPEEGYHFVDPAAVEREVDCVIRSLDALLGEGRRGRLIREGATVVVAGRPNVGKSTLFNALAGSERAIVTAVPGTTRDLISESVDIGGLAVTLVDTAGARDTDDVVEREGVSRGRSAREIAALVLVVVDGSEPLTSDDERLLEETAHLRRIVVESKADLVRRVDVGRLLGSSGSGGFVTVSAATGEGMEALKGAIVSALSGRETLRDGAALSNIRHIALLEQARGHLGAARDAAAGAMPEEFVLADLQAARGRFDEIVGQRTTEDVLQHIFERFCIGK